MARDIVLTLLQGPISIQVARSDGKIRVFVQQIPARGRLAMHGQLGRSSVLCRVALGPTAPETVRVHAFF